MVVGSVVVAEVLKGSLLRLVVASRGVAVAKGSVRRGLEKRPS